MNRLTADRVRDHATALGLAHTAASLSQALERAEAAGSGYLDFLDALLGEELGVRESRRFAAALARSGLPHHRRLSDFDFAFQPGLDVRRIRDLGTCEFVKNKQNVLFLGPPGVGKTMLAVALAVAACEAGFSIYFTTLEDAIRRLSAAQATGRFTTQLRAYQRPHLLVLDEVGYQKLRPEQANMLFQLVSRRYETGSIILSSNKALIDWGSILGDEVLAAAILDRLLHHAEVVTINGPSYRIKDRLALITDTTPPASPDEAEPDPGSPAERRGPTRTAPAAR